jgi:DNA-binding transcriptional ArsR family regulator
LLQKGGVKKTLDSGAENLYLTDRLNTVPLDPLSATFSALADPTRRAILARLASGQASVTELAAPFDISLPAVSKHLKVLERARLIQRGRDAQWRPARLNARPLREVEEWVERYRRFWEASYQRLDALLEQLKAQRKKPRKRRRKKNQRRVP